MSYGRLWQLRDTYAAETACDQTRPLSTLLPGQAG